jgi:mono/diheme cytochrome c family protein
MACVFLVFAALRSKPEHRPRIMRYLGWWFAGGALISYAGYRWWEGVLPDTVTNLFLGAEPLLESLATTRSFTLWSLAAALILGVLALVVAPRLARAGMLVVVALAAFAFFGGYERLREGTRKPFLIHSHMFSNGLLVSDIEAVNEQGLLSRSGWVARAGDDPVEVGRHIFKAQCASCHTLDGYQSIRAALPTVADLTAVVSESGGAVAYNEQCASCHDDIAFEEMVGMLPTADEVREDPEMIRELNAGMIGMALAELYEMGEAYAAHPTGQMIQTQDFSHPYMPPFVGTFEELEALTAYLASLDQSERLQIARKEGGQ